MTKIHDRKWAFRPGRAGEMPHDILWAVHDGENRGISEGEENIGGVPGYGGWSGAERCAFLSYVHACVRGIAL